MRLALIAVRSAHGNLLLLATIGGCKKIDQPIQEGLYRRFETGQ
jgi:hypothetical protein